MFLYGELFKAFQKAKIKYVLVGGLALNLLGAFRNTEDMDILVELSDDNVKKLIMILTKQGYRVKQPVDPMDFAKRHVREDWIKNKNMKAFNFYKDDELKEVDIIIDSPVSYRDARRQAKSVKIGSSLRVPVIALDDLIKMKKKAKRPQDLDDIEQLKLIRKLRRRS